MYEKPGSYTVCSEEEGQEEGSETLSALWGLRISLPESREATSYITSAHCGPLPLGPSRVQEVGCDELRI